jgi:hypothetical protein
MEMVGYSGIWWYLVKCGRIWSDIVGFGEIHGGIWWDTVRFGGMWWNMMGCGGI